jgi:hypothetical protein
VRARSPTNYLSLHRSIGGATVVAQRRRANASAFRAVRSRQPRCRSRPRVFPGAEAETLAIVQSNLKLSSGPISMIASSGRTSKQMSQANNCRAKGGVGPHRARSSPDAAGPARGLERQTRGNGGPASTPLSRLKLAQARSRSAANPRLEHSHPSAAPRGRSLCSEPSTNRLGAMATCAMCVIVTGACRGAMRGGSTSAAGRSIDWAVR